MAQSQTYILLEEEEWDRKLEQAAVRGAREVLRRHREHVVDLNRSLQLSRGLVTKSDLAFWLSVSKSTIDRWGIPVDNKKGHTSFYWLPDVIAFLRGEGGEKAEATERLDQNIALMSSSSEGSKKPLR